MSDVENLAPTHDQSAHPAEKPLEETEKATPVSAKSPSGDVSINNAETIAELCSVLEGPPEVQRRVKALKKIQLEVTRTESDFFQEMHDLEVKYAKKYTEFYEKRREIVQGKYEPTDEECNFKSATEDSNGNPDGADTTQGEDAKLNNSMNKLSITEQAPVSGIPEFWLTIFQNVDTLAEMIEDHDLPILKHLTDIKVEMTTKPMGFKLDFYFSPNEFFTDSVLTKTYEMKCEVDNEDPFSFEGPEIIKCSGCEINWKEGKNVTVRTVRKRQKHKQTGTMRVVSKTQEVCSFFTFFNPPKAVEGKEFDDEEQANLTTHFEIGQYIRERIVPRAVLYYTGEALDDDDDSDDDYEEEDETDDTEGDNSQTGQSNEDENEENPAEG